MGGLEFRVIKEMVIYYMCIFMVMTCAYRLIVYQKIESAYSHQETTSTVSRFIASCSVRALDGREVVRESRAASGACVSDVSFCARERPAAQFTPIRESFIMNAEVASYFFRISFSSGELCADRLHRAINDTQSLC